MTKNVLPFHVWQDCFMLLGPRERSMLRAVCLEWRDMMPFRDSKLTICEKMVILSTNIGPRGSICGDPLAEFNALIPKVGCHLRCLRLTHNPRHDGVVIQLLSRHATKLEELTVNSIVFEDVARHLVSLKRLVVGELRFRANMTSITSPKKDPGAKTASADVAIGYGTAKSPRFRVGCNSPNVSMLIHIDVYHQISRIPELYTSTFSTAALRSITLADRSYGIITDDSFNKFCKECSNITALTLIGLGSVRSYLPLRSLTSLKSLSFESCSLEHNEHHLDVVCRHLSDSLEALEFDQSSGLDACGFLAHLQRLKQFINDDSIQHPYFSIDSLPESAPIESLTLSHIDEIDLVVLSATRYSNSLTTFLPSTCHLVSLDAWEEFLQQHPRLQRLGMPHIFCQQGETSVAADQLLTMVAAYCKDLRYLNLCSSHVTTGGLENFLSSRNKPSVKPCSDLADQNMQQLCPPMLEICVDSANGPFIGPAASLLCDRAQITVSGDKY